jgi:hypothetical protein
MLANWIKLCVLERTWNWQLSMPFKHSAQIDCTEPGVVFCGWRLKTMEEIELAFRTDPAMECSAPLFLETSELGIPMS